MTVPNTFANATTAIPLVQLDQNFNTAITLGNTTVFLGNTTTTLGNVTLTGATVTASGGLTVPTSALGNVYPGRYTPTLTNGTNVAASTAYPLSYMRVGNIVFVGGYINIDTTALGSSSLRMSLPIASNFTSSTDGGGSGSRPVTGGSNDGWVMYSAAATDDMTIDGWSMDTAAQNMFFTFSYQVL